jgi:hypothetical protein
MTLTVVKLFFFEDKMSNRLACQIGHSKPPFYTHSYLGFSSFVACFSRHDRKLGSCTHIS